MRRIKSRFWDIVLYSFILWGFHAGGERLGHMQGTFNHMKQATMPHGALKTIPDGMPEGIEW